MYIFNCRLNVYIYNKLENEKNYIEPETVYYQIVKISYYIFNIKLFSLLKFKERVPMFAVFSNSILGSTTWISEIPKWMQIALKNKIIFPYWRFKK